jgi:hypothetical protein
MKTNQRGPTRPFRSLRRRNMMLTKRMGMTVAFALAATLVASPVQAQRGLGMVRSGGPNLGRSLEIALEHQEELGLTGDQLAQLQEMKAIIDQDLNPLSEEIKALREGVRAGDVDRSEGIRQLQELQGQFLSLSAPLRGRVAEILTVEQHNRLQPLVWQTRPGRAGARAFQGRMGRGGFGPGMRGGRGGAGFRQGFYGQGRVPALGFRGAPRGRGFRPPAGRARFFRRGGGIGPTAPQPDSGVLDPPGF